MAELVMLADIQRTVNPEEVTRQLDVMAQARESLPVIGKAEHLYSALHGTNHFKALRHGSHSF